MNLTIHNIFPIGNLHSSIQSMSLIDKVSFLNRFTTKNTNVSFYKEATNNISDGINFSLSNCSGQSPSLCSTIVCKTAGTYNLAISLDEDALSQNPYYLHIQIGDKETIILIDSNGHTARTSLPLLANDQLTFKVMTHIGEQSTVWGYLTISTL